MSFHRNVRIGYTPAFREAPQNEADVIIYFGGWFHEVEIKVNLKDLKSDIRAIFLALENKDSSSKARKIRNIIYGVSFVDTYSILCPSYNYNQLSDATKSMIRQYGIGVLCYMGDGKVATIEKARTIKKAMQYNKLELITYFNRPTINARSIILAQLMTL
jgi:hypothetical protein